MTFHSLFTFIHSYLLLSLKKTNVYSIIKSLIYNVMNEITDRIFELIAGRLSGELSQQEDFELTKLLDQRPEYRELFEQLQEIHQNTKMLGQKFEPDVELVLKRVKKEGKAGRRLGFGSLLRYVAILVLTLGIGVFYFLHKDQEAVPNRDFSEVSTPGSSKAVLLLGNGRHIFLEHRVSDTLITTEQGALISADSNHVLSYKFESGESPKVAEWNTLSVPRGGEYQLILADGTKVWLNSSSTLNFPEFFAGNERRVKLSGEAFFEVREDKGHPFVVETGRTEIKVLGTRFNINSYEPEVYTTLVEGCVDVRHFWHSLQLNPGEQACGDSYGLTKKEVNIVPYISWRDGRFAFSNTNLEEICGQLSRWYDVDIFFSSEVAKGIRFTGAMLKFRPLEDVVRMIEETSSVRFYVKNKTIIISEN